MREYNLTSSGELKFSSTVLPLAPRMASTHTLETWSPHSESSVGTGFHQIDYPVVLLHRRATQTADLREDNQNKWISSRPLTIRNEWHHCFLAPLHWKILGTLMKLPGCCAYL